MAIPDADRYDDATRSGRATGRLRTGTTRRAGSDDEARPQTSPFGLGVPLLVALALVVAVGAETVTAGVAGTVTRFDAATLEALGVGAALDAVAGTATVAARVGRYTAGLGATYLAVRVVAWLSVRR